LHQAGSSAMNYLIGALAAGALLVYLVVALLNAEDL
jgi:K+-transporting ATPase KdpF subunit